MAGQNLFCEGHDKNKITWFFIEKPGLLWLCRILLKGSPQAIPDLNPPLPLPGGEPKITGSLPGDQ
jgi:hypothetical protein